MIDVTVAVLTFNAEPWLRAQVEACRRQRTQRAVEVLVLDSGSQDHTVALAETLGVRVHEIPNSEFGHGRTRNLAVSLSEADYLVLLTQDAIPASEDWLESLLAPLAVHTAIAATFGSQVPPADCRPAVKRTLQETFRSLSPSGEVVLHLPQERSAGPSFFSNVNAAYRRAVLADRVPFRDIDYAEDMAFAQDAAAAGLGTAYVPTAAVVHAHDYALRAHYARTKADTRGSLRTGGGGPPAALSVTLRNAASLCRRDLRFTRKDEEYGAALRFRHALGAPAFALATAFAMRQAVLESAAGSFTSDEGEQRAGP